MRRDDLPREYYFYASQHMAHVPELVFNPPSFRGNKQIPIAKALKLMHQRAAMYKRSFCIEVARHLDSPDVGGTYRLVRLASRGEYGCGGKPYRLVFMPGLGKGTLYHATPEELLATFEHELTRYLTGDEEAL